jgi:hypothetical protein
MNVPAKMRIYHRYLGFFLAGVMAIYSISGIIMIFRQTDFLKQDTIIERELIPGLEEEALGSELRIRDFRVERRDGDILYFSQGSYDQVSGMALVTQKQLPYVLDKFTKLHKATTNSPLFFMNIFFGLSLFFFVISAFWMFVPSANILRKGIYFTLAGIALVLMMLFI